MAIVAAFAVPHPPLIIPGVGGNQRGQISGTVRAYEEVARRIAALEPDTVVISSPHAAMYLDYLHISPGACARGDFSRFGAPDVRYEVTYDQDFVRGLCRAAEAAGLPAGTRGERDPGLDHGTMVPLHFIQKECRDIKVVRMGLSGLSPLAHYRMGELVAGVADELGRRTVYVASGDLSHKLKETGPYGYAKEGPKFDGLACDAFSTGDFLKLLEAEPGFCERAAECGLRSFQIMAGALDRTPVDSELLSYEGPFGVGYGVAAFSVTGPRGAAPARDFGAQYETWHKREMAERRAAESPWVRLARAALEGCVRTGGPVDAARALEALRAGGGDAAAWDEIAGTRAGCFVSLKVDGQLRGCMGTIEPTRASLAEEICANAVSAGFRDPRFDPVEADELPELVYDVDVLGAPEGVPDAGALDPARYGVIVSAPDGRRGLLLPDLDGIDTVEGQLRIAARKGGIDLERDNVRLERFEVVRHL